MISNVPAVPACPSAPLTGVRKRPTSCLVELGVSSDVPLVRLAGGRVLDSAPWWLGHPVEHPQGSPKVKDAENQANHDDVPGAMAYGPWRQKQFGNAVQGCADGDVLEHKQTVGQQKQSAGDASHHNLPVLRQPLVLIKR